MSAESSSFLKPSATGSSAEQSSTKKPKRRPKVAVARGRSLMDWVRLGKANPDLGGAGGQPKRFTAEEIEKHNKQNDAWMVISKKVFNVTPFMEYHPGGVSELMLGAGCDASKIFLEEHAWVNYDSMLKACFIGVYDGPPGRLKRAERPVFDVADMISALPPQHAVSSGDS